MPVAEPVATCTMDGIGGSLSQQALTELKRVNTQYPSLPPEQKIWKAVARLSQGAQAKKDRKLAINAAVEAAAKQLGLTSVDVSDGESFDK